MNRWKLFAFFTTMAWASLFRPKAGTEMIDCAQFGADERARRKSVEAIFGLGQRIPNHDAYMAAARTLRDEE